MSVAEKIHYCLERLRGEVPTCDLIKNGLQVGENFHRLGECIIDPGHCWHITIGNNVTLAPRVHILAHDASMQHALGYTRIANVTIGNDVFVGAGSIILPGIKIGEGAIIGAGSCVTKNVPAGEVWAGNPAHFVTTVQEFLKRHEQTIEGNTVSVYDDKYTLRKKVSGEMKKQMKREVEQAGYGYVV